MYRIAHLMRLCNFVKSHSFTQNIQSVKIPDKGLDPFANILLVLPQCGSRNLLKKCQCPQDVTTLVIRTTVHFI